MTGLHFAVSNVYDVVVLDLMLPGMDGIDVLQKLRTEAKQTTPILIISARDTLDDKLTGLDAGADDYLVKPFEIKELEARIRALVRRQRGIISPSVLQLGDVRLDTGTLVVKRAGIELKLTPIGLKLLTILMKASPKVVSRSELERQVWGDVLPDSDTLRSHMYNLRKILDRPFEHAMLQTVQSAGYRLVAPDER